MEYNLAKFLGFVLFSSWNQTVMNVFIKNIKWTLAHTSLQ